MRERERERGERESERVCMRVGEMMCLYLCVRRKKIHLCLCVRDRRRRVCRRGSMRVWVVSWKDEEKLVSVEDKV